MPSIVRVRVVIEGSVQGVYFRASTREMAESIGVSGWVRNRDDGTVEAVFEGSRAEVDEAVRWSRSGPPHARVTSLGVIEEVPEGLSGFSIH